MTEADQWRERAYALAKIVRNQKEMSALQFGLACIEELTTIRQIDPKRYDREVKEEK